VDDFASAPAQRASDEGRRIPEGNFAGRRKAVKKAQPAPTQSPDPEPEPAPEPEANHQLDVLA